MNQMPFPKPSPADPLPLEKWLRRTDRAESGREAFFRGRDKEYDTFRSAVLSLSDGIIGGGTMIFQGAPGAGKSALMGECMEAVRCHSTPEDPWVAVDVQPGDLAAPVTLVKQLVEAVNAESERLFKNSSGPITLVLNKLWNMGKQLFQSLSKRGGGVLSFNVGGTSGSEKRQESNMTASEAFFEAAPLLREFNLVVMVDEAQNTPVNDVVRDVIGYLHKPPHKIPLVTAFFGLSDTKQVLNKCGLSRLPDNRVVNLERLLPIDATSAIRGAFDAYNFAGKPEDREKWIDSLAKLSHGWPQHINRVSVAAAKVIQEQGGHVRMKHLEEALKRGQERMDNYYNERLDASSSWDWVYRRLAVAAQDKSGVLSWDDIDVLTETARARGGESTDEFLLSALHAGLLAPAHKPRGHYRIPIPSMSDYLQKLSAEPPSWA